MSNSWELFLLELKAMTTVVFISFREELNVLVSKQDTMWEQIWTTNCFSGLDVNKSIYRQNYWRDRRKHRWNLRFKENKLFVKTLQVFIVQDVLNDLIICKQKIKTHDVSPIIAYRQRLVPGSHDKAMVSSPCTGRPVHSKVPWSSVVDQVSWRVTWPNKPAYLLFFLLSEWELSTNKVEQWRVLCVRCVWGVCGVCMCMWACDGLFFFFSVQNQLGASVIWYRGYAFIYMHIFYVICSVGEEVSSKLVLLS